MLRTPGVTSGNAAEDSADRRGWLVGHFLPGADDPRATGDVEVKWAVYDGGEVRPDWGVNDRAHTLAHPRARRVSPALPGAGGAAVPGR